MSLFLQEWNEACAYARECIVPPVVYANTDPWLFFTTLIAVVFAIWLVNERTMQ